MAIPPSDPPGDPKSADNTLSAPPPLKAPAKAVSSLPPPAPRVSRPSLPQSQGTAPQAPMAGDEPGVDAQLEADSGLADSGLADSGLADSRLADPEPTKIDDVDASTPEDESSPEDAPTLETRPVESRAAEEVKTPPKPPPVAAKESAASKPVKKRPPPTDETPLGSPNQGKATQQRRWFETFFDEDYFRTVPTPSDDWIARQCDFLEHAVNLEAGQRILDVACGQGRHCAELANRGYSAVGLDLSRSMLARASANSERRNVDVSFLHGDMRVLDFRESFDVLSCWGTSFGYFDDETNRDVLTRFHRSLVPNGKLLLDIVNRDYVMRAQPNLVWFEGDQCVCMEETHFNHIKSRLEVKRTAIFEDGHQQENQYAVRLFSIHELGQLLYQHGFRVLSISAHETMPGVFFGSDSPRILVVAERKPGESTRTSLSGPPPTGRQSMPPDRGTQRMPGIPRKPV